MSALFLCSKLTKIQKLVKKEEFEAEVCELIKQHNPKGLPQQVATAAMAFDLPQKIQSLLVVMPTERLGLYELERRFEDTPARELLPELFR